MRRLWDKLRSLKVSLIFMVLGCWLLPSVVLGGFVGSALFSLLREKTEEALLTGAQNTQTLLKASVDSMLSLARDAIYDGELSSAVKRYDGGEIPYSDYGNSVPGLSGTGSTVGSRGACAPCSFAPARRKNCISPPRPGRTLNGFPATPFKARRRPGKRWGPAASSIRRTAASIFCETCTTPICKNMECWCWRSTWTQPWLPLWLRNRRTRTFATLSGWMIIATARCYPAVRAALRSQTALLLYTQRLETELPAGTQAAGQPARRVYARMDFFRLLTGH